MAKNNVTVRVDNLNLAGEFSTPEGIPPPYPLVCFCHGIPAAQHNPAEGGYPALAQRFNEADFATMVFNFRGTGASEGNMDIRGWTVDLRAVLDYLSTIDVVDKSRLAVLGSSGGAGVSVYVAADDDRIRALVTFACPAFFQIVGRGDADTIVKHFRDIGAIRDNDFPPSADEWLKNFYSISPIEYIDKISPRPLYMIHGGDDEVVPVEHVHMLYERAKEPREMTVVPGAGHRLRLEERAVRAALDWLTQKMIMQGNSE
jgi:fermentation-respiration switch protein FrsA (DUF1100 family)